MLTRASGTALSAFLMIWGTGACGAEEAGEADETATAVAEEVEPLDAALAARVPPGASFAQAQEGRKLFAPCAVCHGLDARGTALGSSLRDGEWGTTSGTLEEIEAVIRDGVAASEEYPVPMPVMGGGDFSPEELRALATYVYVIGRGEASP